MTRNHKENITLLGLLTLVLMSGIVLVLPKASADDIVTDVSITVPAVCSITTNANNNTEHSAIVDPGTYESNIGKTTIKTICNDAEGFSIYAIGYTNEEYGNTTLKPVTLDATQNSIITGTATTAGNPDTSNWAIKVSPVTGTYAPTIESDTDGSFSDYHKVPSTYTKVATKTSNTDITAGSSIEITYSAYIAGTQPADLYNGKVKFTMVHPGTAEPQDPGYKESTTESGKICYYPNTAYAEGTMGCQDVASSVTLLASNFSRSGYGFAGWSDKFDYSTGAHFYGPNETISIPDTSIYTGEGKGLSLYAVWVRSQGNLQDTDKVATLCGTGTGSLTKADEATNILSQSITALSDARDNNTYAIAKLADGNCWMIENLRLESTASHNTDGSLAQGYHSSFAGLANAESANFFNSTTANNLYSTDGSTTKTIDSTGNYLGYRFPRYNNLNTFNRAQNEPNSNTFTDNNTTPGMYSYGNYYTWHAAIANTTHYSDPTAQVDGKTSETVGTSLCPTGWKLPLGNTSTGDIEQGASDSANKVGGFSYLDRKMGGTGDYQTTEAGSLRWRKFPLNFLYSGLFSTSSAYDRGRSGRYWSSTAYSSSNSYYLTMYSSSVFPGTSNLYKYYGFSIRCISGS